MNNRYIPIEVLIDPIITIYGLRKNINEWLEIFPQFKYNTKEKQIISIVKYLNQKYNVNVEYLPDKNYIISGIYIFKPLNKIIKGYENEKGLFELLGLNYDTLLCDSLIKVLQLPIEEQPKDYVFKEIKERLFGPFSKTEEYDYYEIKNGGIDNYNIEEWFS